MDPVSKAAELTSHIKNETRRDRVKGNLAAFLTSLEQITVVDPDEDLFRARERDQNDTRFNDGIEGVSAQDFKARDRNRVREMKQKLNPGSPEEANKPLPSETLDIIEGEDINARGRFGYTKLVRAVMAGNEPAVKAIIAANADPFIRDNAGMTALTRARLGDSDSIVTLLEVYEDAFIATEEVEETE